MAMVKRLKWKQRGKEMQDAVRETKEEENYKKWGHAEKKQRVKDKWHEQIVTSYSYLLVPLPLGTPGNPSHLNPNLEPPRPLFRPQLNPSDCQEGPLGL